MRKLTAYRQLPAALGRAAVWQRAACRQRSTAVWRLAAFGPTGLRKLTAYRLGRTAIWQRVASRQRSTAVWRLAAFGRTAIWRLASPRRAAALL